MNSINLSKIREIYHSEKLFVVEKSVMRLFGLHSLSKWKVCRALAIVLTFMLGPQVNLLRNAIIANDNKTIALTVPEFLITAFTISSVVIFTLNYEKVKNLFDLLEESWEFPDESLNEKWNEIRKKRALFCNRLSLFSQVVIQCNGLVYTFIPTMVFVVQCYLMESNEKYTVFMVE